jgi:uncharacterized protein
MRVAGGTLVLAPTDLSSFIACRHRTGLDLAVARGRLHRPEVSDPFADILRRLGEGHEQQHVASLRASGLNVVAIHRSPDARDLARETDETLQAMQAGADVVVQARLAHGSFAGYADLLVRVETPSALGAWSYEVHDTKLARETKGGTILQLCAYSDLLGQMQGRVPERFHVVVPAGGPEGASPRSPLPEVSPPQYSLKEGSPPRYPLADGPPPMDAVIRSYRVEDYLAYYRMVRSALVEAVALDHEVLVERYYPEPVEHCSVCRWEPRCYARRRDDDHLSFVAGIGRGHRVELTAQGYPTLAAAAAMPVPVDFRPARGARETFTRIGHQARVQHQQRTEGRPVVEHLPVTEGEGVCALPEPSSMDVFLDLEGSRFARDGGREFLFGVWHGGRYRAGWALCDADEKAAFEAVMDLITAAWASDPAMHVYHFNHYEPSAFKRLVGRHATRAEALDRLLRAGRFVDLYPITRQAVRAGVESYSIKKLEQYTGYRRQASLETVGHPLLAVELALESSAPDCVTPDIRQAVEAYNEDDCRSTEALRDWLEGIRSTWIARGTPIDRPESGSGDAPLAVDARQQEVAALRARLLADCAPEAAEPWHADHPRWLLAYLLDWHRREINAEWWDYYRLLELPEEDLLDEKKAIAGLEHVMEVEVVRRKGSGKPTGSVIHRYRYPTQELEIGRKGSLKLQTGANFGTIVAHDREARLIDVKTSATEHPTHVFSHDIVPNDVLQGSVLRLAGRALEQSASECGLELLYRRAPRLVSGSLEPLPGETATERAVRVATNIDRTTLAIQGPPGAGKTYTGAGIIRGLIKAGRKVGVTANSHAVIRNLLLEVTAQAEAEGETVLVGARAREAGEEGSGMREFEDHKEALGALASGMVQVLGGTAWLWAAGDAAGTVDVLVVDEAGQMSLANVLAVSQAAGSLVLLGDPQQLDQPQKAHHPDGVGVSALEHVLGGAETMPSDRGIFLPTTYRMSPALCAFTSELFYENKLEAKPGLERQALTGTRGFDGSRLWLVPVEHDGNQGASDEEVDAVAALVESLLVPAANWIDERGEPHPLTGTDLRVVAPFNAHVNRLSERLMGIPVGTVDKFQGQTAAVVIYSMATSRPADAPHGMAFLYSLNRLNVATSRARCAVFVVCSPRLLEPECRTPGQMRLANALCRYRELATRPGAIRPGQGR